MKKKTPATEFFAEARARTGLTQKELAPLLRTTAHMVSQYETGSRQPTKRVLALIRQILIDRGLANDPCTAIEHNLLQEFRQLTPDDQGRIADFVTRLMPQKRKAKAR